MRERHQGGRVLSTDINNSLAQVLLIGFYGRDCKVRLDKVPSGIWVWNEKSPSHVRFTLKELSDVLGFSSTLEIWVKELPIFHTSWKFINPTRLQKLPTRT